jgi:ferredoxin--NADP+ reductase
MGIPGEDLAGSHTATEFVAWYNGHPDYRDREFDLSGQRVAVVGVGNVAVDVARILCRLPEELERTDIADHALAALAKSGVREVHMLGRRGPAQAAFTNAEVRELGELAGADIEVVPEEIALDPLSAASVARAADRTLERKLAILNEFVGRPPAGHEKKLQLRFLVSPTEVLGDATGRVRALRLVRNELYETDDGTLRPRPTGHHEEIPVDLVFRSVGYRGVPVPGVPFDERSGCIPNVAGRVVEAVGGTVVPGVYASGWIKRGPSGVIGTNKPDAGETADAIATDLANGALPDPPIATGIEALVRERQRAIFSFEDWKRVDAIEVERGAAVGRPRVKCVTRADVERALGRA